MDSDGVLHENTVVVRQIEETLHQEFCCYGYKNMTGELKEKGWIINLGEGLPPDEGAQIALQGQDPGGAF